MTDAEEIKLAALKRKLRRAKHNAKASSNAHKDWEHRALTAEAERDALKQDAELYRHLRDHFAKTATDAKAEFERLEPLTGAAFDSVVRASIDAMGVAV